MMGKSPMCSPDPLGGTGTTSLRIGDETGMLIAFNTFAAWRMAHLGQRLGGGGIGRR